jgi:hypothetical protein
VEAVLCGLWFIGAGLVLHLELKPVEQSRDNNRAARVFVRNNNLVWVISPCNASILVGLHAEYY